MLKPGTQACIDALAAAGGLDTATEMQAVRGAIAQFDVAPAPRATEVVNPGPILERVPFSKE